MLINKLYLCLKQIHIPEMANQIMNKFCSKPQIWQRLMTQINPIRSLSSDHQLDKHSANKTQPLSKADIQKIDEFVDVETHTGQVYIIIVFPYCQF